jgi:DNA polymerase-3 subunit alpha (Gram-positive type)
MSVQDGISTPNELFTTAKNFNTPALGVTDKYNIQAFFDIEKAAKENNVKAIYGVEVAVYDEDTSIIVVNQFDGNINEQTYIIFDIETTGLNCWYDEIIQFGAVKIRNGNIIDELNIFIKPTNTKLDQTIISLTNITEEMLNKHGIEISVAIAKIKAFVNNDILVAHNAVSFDIRFLNN